MQVKRIPAQFDGRINKSISLLKKTKLKVIGYINLSAIQFNIELDPKSARYVMECFKVKNHKELRGKTVIVLIK